jgi:hypothetical protein
MTQKSGDEALTSVDLSSRIECSSGPASMQEIFDLSVVCLFWSWCTPTSTQDMAKDVSE